MQFTEVMRQNSEEVYRLTDEVVLRLADAALETTRLRIAEIFREELNMPGKGSPGMREVMLIIFGKLKILPDTQDAEPHPGP